VRWSVRLTRTCTRVGAAPRPPAAGSRTQAGPSSEHYPQNEVWLDFKTNGRGNAVPRAGQYWRFNSGQASQAGSVVIHSHATKWAVACITVPFYVMVAVRPALRPGRHPRARRCRRAGEPPPSPAESADAN
jgi:hypothetical protein